VKAIDALLETGSDREVATALNQAGHKNWKGERFTAKKVAFVRNAYQLKSRFERLRDRGMLTGNELAKRLGVCTTTIHQWGREGVLNRHLYGNKHRCLYEPIPNVRLEKKGVGGRRAKPPIFTTVSST
jgi:DNA-binding XRE family transcriptional regulator